MPETKPNPEPVLLPFSLSIAGHRFRLWLPPALHRSAQRRYRTFLIRTSGKADLSIRIRQLPPPSARKRGLPAVSMTWSKAGAEIHRDDFTFHWAGRGRDAWLECRGGIFTLDSFLRVLLSSVLVQRGGFLLHAAGLMRGSTRGLALPGLSGSGKSTAARLCAGRFSVLNDELVALTPAGPGNRWHVHGTPFWGGFKGRGMNRRASLSGLCFLHKGSRFGLRVMAKNEALAGLLKCILFFDHSPGTVAQLFKSAGRCLARVPALRVTFARSHEFAAELARAFQDSNRSLISGL